MIVTENGDLCLVMIWLIMKLFFHAKLISGIIDSKIVGGPSDIITYKLMYK